MLNVLKSSFFTYLIVLMKSARKENKFSNLTELFQNLIDEKNRQRAESVVSVIRKEAGNESKRENNKGEEDKDDSNEKNEQNNKKNKCSRCDRSPHSKEKCPIINFECTECHKTGH
jgi:hypothetical protein